MLRVITKISFLLPLLFTACSYQFSSKKRQLVDGYKLAAVPVFKNLTQEPSVETFFTNSLKKEINRSQIAKIADKNTAPVTIQGTIKSISIVAGAPGSVAQLPANAILIAEYRIYITTDIHIIRNADKKSIWQGSFSGEQSYLAPQIGTESINSSNALYNHSARLQNFEFMAKDMMNEAFNRMTENF